MTLELSTSDLRFRDELRRWLDVNLPAASDAREWHRRLVRGRWVVPAWPERWGGRNATVTQEIIYNQEMGARDAPVPRNAIALFNIGPMLLHVGSPAQQERYLPKMVTADEIWCQGFSEPNAGSDLAALETRAEDRGEHFVVTGQKTWNTYGHEADLCLALVRTDGAAPKHKGLSALIIDMHAPGIEVRPLREITGDDGFNEIFFTEVSVPKTSLVGPLNEGWKIAMSTLLYERLGTMKLGVQLRRQLEGVIALALELEKTGDPIVRQKLAALGIQVDLMELLTERALEAIRMGEDPGPCLPLGKLQWSYLMQDLAELALRIAGPRAQLDRGSKYAVPGNWPYHAVYARMTTIGAGTTEVQKNIIASRVLGLPRDLGAPPQPALRRDRTLDEPRRALRDSIRRFLRERAPIRYVRSMLDDARGYTADVWSALASLGVTGILVPERFGGLGLGYEDMGIALEELGRALFPGPFLATALGVVAAIRATASEEAAGELLQGIATGSLVATLALDEPTSADDLARIETRAEKNCGDRFTLTGIKIAPDAASADAILVVARSGAELGLFLAEASIAEISPLKTVDRTRRLAEVVFRGAAARRIGTGDASTAIADARDRIRVGLVVDAVGAADRALEIAVEYAKVRRQFDRPIGAFQAVQHKLADMLRNIELARSGAYEALRLADGDNRDAFHRAATMAKAFAGDALYRVTADAIQVFGGIGFTWEHDAHLYYKRAMSMQQILGGTEELQEEYARLLLAR